MRRVVVTGLGMVTPLGSGVEHTWSRLIAGDSGAGPITAFETADLACRIACARARCGDGSDGTFDPDAWMEPKEQRKVDPFIVFAMAAADQALDDAGWHPEELRGPVRHRRDDRLRHRRHRRHLRRLGDPARDRGPRRISPFFIPGRIINLASRPGLDRARAQGPEQRRGHRLLHRRPRHRRRRAA